MMNRAHHVKVLLGFSLVTLAASAACSRQEEPVKKDPVEQPKPAATGASGGAGGAAAAPGPKKTPEKAPDLYKTKFSTSKGDFTIEVHRDWAPNGADRFYELVKSGFYDDARFFRVVSGFMVQFGIHPKPEESAKWHDATIPDDPPKQSNKRGYITFATSGKDSRTTQVFISFGDNARLDSMGFAPFGKVEGDGMKVVDQLYSGYGEGAPGGNGPAQHLIQGQGNAYLNKDFPKLDFIKKTELL